MDRGDRTVRVRVRVRVRMAGTSTKSHYKTTVYLDLKLPLQVEHLDLVSFIKFYRFNHIIV